MGNGAAVMAEAEEVEESGEDVLVTMRSGVLCLADEPNTPTARVVDIVMERLKAFDEAITENEILEIDGLSINGEACDKITQESKIKVLNHRTEIAYEVEIDTIVQTPLKDLMAALITGELVKCYGITRIVGYYSRIQNWNSSKTAELADRRKGNYWEKQRVNTEKIGLLRE